MRSLFSTVLLTVTLGSLSAQSDSFPSLKIGEWRQHLPWQRSKYVTQSDSKVYFASEWAVVEIDKADRSPRFLTKVEGLSDVGMRLIRYNRDAAAVVMAYTNSNLDIYYPADGSVVNLPFIKKNINIIGDKQIYDITFEGKIAYIACGFGVLKLNLEKEEVEWTVFTSVVVKSVAFFDGNDRVFLVQRERIRPRLRRSVFGSKSDTEKWHIRVALRIEVHTHGRNGQRDRGQV